MIEIEIVTPERVVHTLSGVEVLLPTVSGQIGVRKGHVPLIAPLIAGEIVVKQTDGEELYAVAGGFVQIVANKVHIMADSAERADELSEHLVHEAIARAKQLKAEATEQVAFDDAAAMLAASIARLKVLERRKRKR